MHGLPMIMVGGYVAWMVFDGFGLGPIPGMVAAAGVAFVFGVVILQSVVSGLVMGSVYALMTVGMTLINMAHGSASIRSETASDR